MRESTKGGLLINLALSLSHDYSTRMNCGILLGCSPAQAKYLTSSLIDLASLALHPLLLPTIITGWVRSTLRWHVDELWSDMLFVEAESGLTKWPIIDRDGRVHEPMKCNNYRTASESVLGVMQSTTVWQRHVETSLLQVEALRDRNRDLWWRYEDWSDWSDDLMLEASHIIEERLRFIRYKAVVLLPLLDSIEKRTTAQMTAVGGVLGFLTSAER